MKIQILIIVLLFLLGSCKQDSKNEKFDIVDPQIEYNRIGALLDSVHVEDQKYRGEVRVINEEFGWDSDEMRNQWEKIGKIDSSNLVIVEKVLKKHGWLSADQIGKKANSTLFLVIQHSDQETQEKYLPMMRTAVREGKANSTNLALLEDRIGLGKGELQVYGSQIGTDQETGKMYVLPLMEPEKVNERRAKVGLGPIEDYISHWDLVWDVKEYKKNGSMLNRVGN